jgi:type I restriction enzyme M protein
VITGDLKSKIDRIWDAFWSGGISNPLEVMEQITFLLFIRRLDELQTLKENRARRLHEPVEDPTFPALVALQERRPRRHVQGRRRAGLPLPATLGGEGSTYADHMKDARFTIPTPALLAKVVDMLAEVPMD